MSEFFKDSYGVTYEALTIEEMTERYGSPLEALPTRTDSPITLLLTDEQAKRVREIEEGPPPRDPSKSESD